MANLFSALIDYMQEEEWRYEIIEGETVIRFQVKTSAGRLHCYGEVHEEKDWMLFYSYLPVHIPEEKLAAAAELITRANRGMRIGNFELDYEDGEVRYKTSIDVEGGHLTHKMIDNLLHANLSTMDRYFAGLMKVIYADRSPAELIEEVERPGAQIDEFDGLEDFDDLDFEEDEDDLDEAADVFDDDEDEYGPGY